MPAKLKYAALWDELKAIDVRETWFVASERFNVAMGSLSIHVCRKMGKGRYRAHTVPGGILFVRIL